MEVPTSACVASRKQAGVCTRLVLETQLACPRMYHPAGAHTHGGTAYCMQMHGTHAAVPPSCCLAAPAPRKNENLAAPAPRNNENLARLSLKIITPLMFAHVRAAYPGIPVSEQNCEHRGRREGA
eukprot:363481-Chlamydomonas_euryale.AAC.6